MNDLTEQPSAEHQQADENTRPPARPVPAVIRNEGPGSRWGRRHVKGTALIRLLAAAWLVILGCVFCASGHWWGALFFAAAGLLAWLAYQLPRSKRALDAGQHVPQPR